MKSIYQKILAVQQEVENIPKSGYNSFNKYHYATEADVLAVKTLMNKHGLIAFPSTVAYETTMRGDSLVVIQHIKYTVVDVESGESVESMVLGVGEDKGDKGAYKGATGGNKYFYLKFFGVATGDDPENDQQGQKPGKPQAATAQRSGGSGNRSNMSAPASKQERLKTGGALIAANKILALQKQHALSNEQVLQIGGIESIKGLTEAGRVEDLEAAYNRLNDHIKYQQSQAG